MENTISHTQDISDMSAINIYQDHLDTLSNGLLTCDFDLFQSRMDCPNVVRMLASEFMFNTVEEQRDAFGAVCNDLRAQGITDLIQIVISARFETPDVIVGEHVTHRIKHALRLTDPYCNRIRLERGIDQTWRETHCANAIQTKARGLDTIRFPDGTLPAPELGTDLERKTT